MKKEVKDFNKKKIIIPIIIVLVIMISVITYIMIDGKKDYSIVDVKPTISVLEDGTYYIFGAGRDISFELEKKDDFSYEIRDEDNNIIKTTTKYKDNKVTINAPEGNYEDGKNYTLSVKNGNFIDEELKDATAVSFSIIRESKQEEKIKEEVKKLNNIKVEDNKFKSNEDLNVGDIVIIDNNAYRITEGKKDVYTVEIPNIEDVYDELDYYGTALLDLDKMEGNKEIEDYLNIYAQKVLLPKFIMDVDAASNVKVTTDYNKKDKEMVAKFHFETNPNDKVFNKSFLKYHRLEFDYEVKLALTINYDINLPNVDVNLGFIVKNTPSVKLSHASETLDDIKNGLKEYCKSENVLKNLKKDYKNINSDKKSLDQNVGTLIIPTPISGLNVELNIGLIMDFDVKANMNATLTNTNTATLGFSTKKGIYGNLSYSNNIDANAFGEASMRLGSDIDAALSLLGTLKLRAKVKGGIYGKANIDINTKINKDELSTSLDATTSAGLFTTTGLSAEMWNNKKEKVIFDKEVELYNYTLPLKASNKTEDKKTEEAKPVVGTKETTTKKSGNISEKVTSKKTSQGNKSPNKKYRDIKKLVKDYFKFLKSNPNEAKKYWVENNYDVSFGAKHTIYNNRDILFNTSYYYEIEDESLMYFRESFSETDAVINARKKYKVYEDGRFDIFYCYGITDCAYSNVFDTGIKSKVSIIEVDGFYYILEDILDMDDSNTKLYVKVKGDLEEYRKLR